MSVCVRHTTHLLLRQKKNNEISFRFYELHIRFVTLQVSRIIYFIYTYYTGTWIETETRKKSFPRKSVSRKSHLGHRVYAVCMVYHVCALTLLWYSYVYKLYKTMAGPDDNNSAALSRACDRWAASSPDYYNTLYANS